MSIQLDICKRFSIVFTVIFAAILSVIAFTNITPIELITYPNDEHVYEETASNIVNQIVAIQGGSSWHIDLPAITYTDSNREAVDSILNGKRPTMAKLSEEELAEKKMDIDMRLDWVIKDHQSRLEEYSKERNLFIVRFIAISLIAFLLAYLLCRSISWVTKGRSPE